jgi:DNA-binding beta-propeller fold protein YncE
MRSSFRLGAGWVVGTALAVVIGACAGKAGGGDLGPVVYPPPPDTARIQYLTSISSETDLGKGRSALDQILGRKTQVSGIIKPYGLAIGGGRIYVCDEDQLGIDIIDLNAAQIRVFRPESPHGIRRAINCFVDHEGLLYVTDLGLRRVAVFDTALVFQAAFGGEDDGQPADVFVSGDRIFVSSLGGELRVRVYDRVTREFLYGFPTAEAADSTGLSAPVNLTVAADTVWVTDLLKQQVFVFTADGQFVRTVGRPGQGPSTFQRPKGIARDRRGLLYVVDSAFENVQVFSPGGQLLMFFGGGGQDPGDMLLPAKVIIDYEHLDYFQRYVKGDAQLQYLILVTNQFGPSKIAIYGFIGPVE